MGREIKIKISMLVVSIAYFILYVILHVYACSYEKYMNENYSHCDIMIYQDSVLQPIATVTIGVFIVSILTFFISDKIFKKWLKFTFWWFSVAIIWIAISPDSVNFLAIPATKENVSIWMSVGFVIISLVMFIWMTIKERKNQLKY